MWDWVSFVVGLWAGVVGLLIVANFAAKPMEAISDIKQCRQSPEWCQIQEPELYEAMYGDPE